MPKTIWDFGVSSICMRGLVAGVVGEQEKETAVEGGAAEARGGEGDGDGLGGDRANTRRRRGRAWKEAHGGSIALRGLYVGGFCSRSRR